MREGEERRIGDPELRGRGATGEDMGRKRAQKVPTKPSRSRSAVARIGAANAEVPMPRNRQDPTSVAVEERGAAPTPWRLWTAAHGGKSETPMAQSNLTAVIDDIKKELVSK